MPGGGGQARRLGTAVIHSRYRVPPFLPAWFPIPRRGLVLTAMFLLFLLTACSSGRRTVAVELQDEQGQPARIPDDSTPVTIAIVCAPTNLAPCQGVSRQARALVDDGVSVVVVGVASEDPNVFSMRPFTPEQEAELHRDGAHFGVDVGGNVRTWLRIAPTGGAVVAADGEVLLRVERDASAEQLIDKARRHGRMARLWAAIPSAKTITGSLGVLILVAVLLIIVILRPRPFARAPLTPGVPFTLSGRTPRKRTSLWLKDTLSLKSGKMFDDEFWPEGLGVILDLRVTVDGREAFAGQVHVTDSGPSGLKMFVLHWGTKHSATKLLLRVDTPRGAEVVVNGTATLGSETVASRLVLLMG